MEPDAARLAKHLFEVALELRPETRAAFLDRSCSGQPWLRREVESLLAEDRLADGFMSGPALRRPGRRVVAREGVRFGPYRIVGKLGEGGMGEVFLAERAEGGAHDPVAVKVMRERLDTPEMRARFDSERHILATFEHANVARLLDGGSTADGTPYVVMELVRGLPITEYCDRHRLGVHERLQMFQKVCAAVHYAHQHLVVHRDLKPSNVLVDETGEPKLVDFGIAKVLEAPDATEQGATATERRMLTPRYASPEHILGERITITSDVYSLGVLLYELLTGRLPYAQRGRTLAELAAEIRSEQAARPSRVVLEDAGARTSEEDGSASHSGAARSSTPEALSRQLEGDLDTVVLRCLRGDPSLRYPSVHELAEDLSRYRSGRPIQARPASAGYLLSKLVLRHRVAVLNAGLAFGLILSSAVLLAVQARRLAAERDVAQAERAVAEQERRRADSISRLLIESFEAADPYRVRNAEMTAREVLERGAERVERRLSGEPETRAEMLHTIGRVYGRLGVFDRAEELVAEAVELRRSDAGSDRLELARSLRELANLKSELGELPAAERLVEESLEIQRSGLASPPEIADSLRLRADVAGRRGEPELAERLASEAVRIERQAGDDPERVAQSLNVLTKVRLWAGALDEAESSGREALELARTVYDDGDAMLTSYLNHLAVALWRNGSPMQAEPLFVEALRSMREALGERHPSVASPLNNLANLLQSAGRHEEAEALLREALEILHESSIGRHPNVAQVLANLGVAVQARGELAEAESLFRRSWSMSRELLGEEHTSSLQSADLLTRVLIERDALEEARSIQRRILELRRGLFGEESEHAVTSLLFLAYCWHKEGEMSKAEELYRQARDIARASLGAGHWLVARIEIDLADVLGSTGHLAEALDLAERAAPTLGDAFPEGDPEHWRAAYATSILAGLRMQRGDRDVESLLLESQRTLRRVKGETALVTREAEERIARFRAMSSP